MGSIYKRGKVYWIGYVGTDGKQHCESSNSKAKAAAIRLLDLRAGDIAHGLPVTPAFSRFKFDDAMTDVLNDYKANRRRSLADVERRITLHLTPYFGRDRRMGSITTADVRAYIAARQAETEAVWRSHKITLTDGSTKTMPERRRQITKGTSASQINRELAILKRAYTLAVQAGKLLHRPHIPMLEERNVRKGFFEKKQHTDVRAHLPEHLRGVTTFAYITGWRIRSEVLPLQWRHVDLEAGEVRLDAGTTKNDEARSFVMTTELKQLLDTLRKRTDTLERAKGRIIPWVFHREGKRIRSFYGTWRSACKAAGVPGRILHDFRRTAVRNLVRAGVPERVAMQMTGHKTRSVFERYNIVSEGDLREAARKLDALVR